MKKVIVGLVMLFLGTNVTTAQELFRLGAKGGVNFATFSGDGTPDYDNPESRTSFHLGLVAEFPVAEKFSILAEVLYSGQGFDITDRDNENDIEYQLDYINVPVLAKIYLFEGFALEAGPQIGFLVNSEIDFDPSSNNDSSISLNEDQFNKMDFSLAMGLSYTFANSFFIQGRYTLGLSNIYDDSFSGNIFSASDARHSVFQAGIGFMF